MRRKGLAGTIAAAVLVIALAVILAVSCFILKRYVVMGGQLFAKNQQVLDLRTRAITRDEFDHLSWKMPGTKILWSVPLSGGYADSTTEILTVTHFSQGDVELLAYFPNLTTVDAQSSTDYGPLGVAYTRYPDIAFRYTVPIAGKNYAPDTTTVTPETVSQEDIRLMEALPASHSGWSCASWRSSTRSGRWTISPASPGRKLMPVPKPCPSPGRAMPSFPWVWRPCRSSGV